MKLHYITIENEKETHICETDGDLPIVGQYVYISDSRTRFHKTKYEVSRVDHSVTVFTKPIYFLDPAVKLALTSDNAEEVNKLIGGNVFCINFTDNVIEFSKTHAEVFLKKVD